MERPEIFRYLPDEMQELVSFIPSLFPFIKQRSFPGISMGLSFENKRILPGNDISCKRQAPCSQSCK